MSLAAKLVLAIALLVAGFAGGIKWHVGIVAERDLEAQTARETDAKQQRQFNDVAAGKHAAALVSLNSKLGAANAQIASLSGRECFGDSLSGMLSDIGNTVPAAASDPASAAPAASSGGGLRFTTDRDAASAIALCRTRYGEVADQLNQILDIEDRRWPR